MENHFQHLFNHGIFSYVWCIILIIIITKLIGNKTRIAMKGRYVKVIETVSIGFDKHIYLVKAGDDYLILASAGKNIEFISKVNVMEDQEIEANQANNIFDFKTLFEKYIRPSQKDINKKNTGDGIKKSVISNNIERLKRLGNFTNDKNGVEGNEKV